MAASTYREAGPPAVFARFADFPRDIRLMVWEEHFLGCFGDRRRAFQLPMVDLMKAKFLQHNSSEDFWVPCEFCKQSKTMYLARDLRAHLESHHRSTSPSDSPHVGSASAQTAIERVFSMWPPGLRDADLKYHGVEAVEVAHAVRRHYPLLDFWHEPAELRQMDLLLGPTHINWGVDLIYFDLPRVVPQAHRNGPRFAPARTLGRLSFSQHIRALALNIEPGVPLHLGVGEQMELDVLEALNTIRELPALQDVFLLLRPARFMEVEWQATLLRCLRALPGKDSAFFTACSLDQFQRGFAWPKCNKQGRGSWRADNWGAPRGTQPPSCEERRLARAKFTEVLRGTADMLARERRSAKIHWVFTNGLQLYL